MMDGKTVRNMLSHSKIKKKIATLVQLVGFTIEIYYYARPYERQTYLNEVLSSCFIVGYELTNLHKLGCRDVTGWF